MAYVDDLLLTGNDTVMIQETRIALRTTFKIKDLGEIRYFVGIELARHKDGILMH